MNISAVSQNQLGGYGRGRSGWKYRSTKRAYDRAVELALRGNRISVATTFRRLLVTRIYKRRKRAFDEGNLVGGFKPLIDALTGRGLVVDDSPRFVKIWYEQRPSTDGDDHVEVTIEEQII